MVIKSLTVSLLFLVLTAFANPFSQPETSVSTNTLLTEGEGMVKAESVFEKMENLFKQNYESLGEAAEKPSYSLYKKALIGYYNLKKEGKLTKDIITIIDFTQPSNKNRLWVINLATNTIMFNDLVAHGRNTGNILPENFSNKADSHMSSIGFYVTGDTYIGKHGLSLRLQGMEAKFNDNAMGRSIVLHGADYVSQDFIKNYGRLGRSYGCPAVSQKIYKQVINAIEGKSCLFIYSPALKYNELSTLLNQENALSFLNNTKLLL